VSRSAPSPFLCPLETFLHKIDGFLIIAGDFVDRFEPGAKPSRMFSWKPGTAPRDTGVDLGDLNPEAIVITGDSDKARILILSDDGKYPGRKGKTVFRGIWLEHADARQREGTTNGGKEPTATLREFQLAIGNHQLAMQSAFRRNFARDILPQNRHDPE
jgi:hypothetical protein